MTIFRKKQPLKTFEVVEVTEVNFLEVTEKFITYVVVPKNGSFHNLLAKSNCFICGLKWPRRSRWKVAEHLKLLTLTSRWCTESFIKIWLCISKIEKSDVFYLGYKKNSVRLGYRKQKVSSDLFWSNVHLLG